MSLYNELRPATFEEVVGQKNIVTQLKGLLEAGLPASILLVGPRGVGKTTAARILAKSVNCKAEGVEPCNSCDSCRSITNGSSMDVVELDAASNNKVEDIRKIIDTCMYTPVYKNKVYILDEVHMLSKAAFNCLLKTLEEPPANCIFILCTTEEEAIPATILSRCAKFYFEQLDLADITSYLEGICNKYQVAYELPALQMIARASDGCMRDALSILEIFLLNESLTAEEVAKSLGIEQEDVVLQILNGILLADLPMALNAFHNSIKKGRSTASLVKALIEACCETVYVQKGATLSMHTQDYVERIAEIATLAGPETLMQLAKEFSELLPAVSKTGKGNFTVEAAIIRSMNTLVDNRDLLMRVKQLEEKVTSLEAGVISVAPCTPVQTGSDGIAEPESSNLITKDVVMEENTDASETEEQKDTTVSSSDDMYLPLDEEPLPDFLPGDIYQSVNGSFEALPIEESKSAATDHEMNAETVQTAANMQPFRLPDDIHLPEGTHISGSISLEELSGSIEKADEKDVEESMDLFGTFSQFARR